MNKLQVVYWSGTGNTQMMAEAIGAGIKEAGKEAEVLAVSQASVDALKEEQVFALGCSSMGVEVLEEWEMEPFVTELEKHVSGKTIALFGSYGWGDGEWMRNWVDRMTEAGATVLNGEGTICNETPDESSLAECRALGAKLAAC